MEFEYIRSRRKTIAIEIKEDGRVLVRAPYAVSEEKIKNFVQDKASWIRKWQEKLRNRPTPERITCARREELRVLAKEKILPRVHFWSEMTGLPFGRITITSARHRFGSCSGKNDLSFTLYLALFPQRLVDYVIVHELCHTREHNHSQRFYHLLESIIPDWKALELELKDAILPIVDEN